MGNGPNFEEAIFGGAPYSDGGLCSGQLLIMWSAVCSVHTHMLTCRQSPLLHGCFVPTDPSSQPV